MMLIRDFYNIQEQHRPSVVSIGNFDGVHLGHVRLLGLLKEKAQTLGVKATAMTFEPHPHEFFSPQNAPPRLLRWRDKIEKLTDAGVDQVFSLRFNQALEQVRRTPRNVVERKTPSRHPDSPGLSETAPRGSDITPESGLCSGFDRASPEAKKSYASPESGGLPPTKGDLRRDDVHTHTHHP